MEIIFDKIQENIVKTTAAIEKNTIISEYSGQVFFLEIHYSYKNQWFNNGINT